MLHVFTLHESVEDFRVQGAVLARSPQEAASILGGEYVACEGQPPASSTNLNELNLYGKIRFAAELFRQFSSEELSQMKLDYTPSKLHYERFPGFVLWVNEGEGKELVLRRNFVLLPEYIKAIVKAA